MRVATASLDYYHQNSEPKARAAGARVRRQHVDFVGFTEVRSEVMREGLKAGLGSGYELVGEHRESPVAYNKAKWEHIDSMVKEGTPGRKSITPTLNLVINVFRSRSDPTQVVEIITTHLVPLTLHGKKRPNFAERMQMWRHHWALIKEVVHDAMVLGHTSFIIGDFNNSAAGRWIIKQIHPKAKWVVRHGLDWIFVVEGTTRVRRFGITRRFRTGSDHIGYWRQLVLK